MAIKRSDGEKRRSYLAAIGWPAGDVAALVAVPSRQAMDALECLLVESAEARRMLRACKAAFPDCRVTAINRG